MSLSVRTRFEVFKRDRFTCQYCGRATPNVLLEADHIIPRAAGGSDEMENLVTSCWDCNRGKSDRLLEEGSHPIANAVTVAELQERVAQAQAYAELSQTMVGLLEKQVGMVNKAWAVAFHAIVREQGDGRTLWTLSGGEGWPDEASIRTFLRRGLPVQTILEAVDETATRFDFSYGSTCRYFYAICWRRIKRPNE